MFWRTSLSLMGVKCNMASQPAKEENDQLLDQFKKQIFTRHGKETLASHLEKQYSISITQITELDVGVYRIDKNDGLSWIARLFPASRPLEDVKAEAKILQFLQQDDFPAERLANLESVSLHGSEPVLVTEFIEGTKPRGGEKTFYRLGDLLGRLHSLSDPEGVVARNGGAWHHISLHGGPREEIEAAKDLLLSFEKRISDDEQEHYGILRSELENADDCKDLPQALIHPDFVLANAVVPPGGGFKMIDWSGVGRGPRLWSLAWTLWAAGCWDMERVKMVMAGYMKHVGLGGEELDKLEGVMRVRPLVIGVWEVCMGRKGIGDVLGKMEEGRELRGNIAEMVRKMDLGKRKRGG
jgi:Ser/Thr protein kinase RdoA (MazF antagonist)